MKIREKIHLNQVRCEECGNQFFELSRRPLNFCPHCKEEMSFFNSEQVNESFIELQIDTFTGESVITKKR